jgi:hypothetical protein
MLAPRASFRLASSSYLVNAQADAEVWLDRTLAIKQLSSLAFTNNTREYFLAQVNATGDALHLVRYLAFPQL